MMVSNFITEHPKQWNEVALADFFDDNLVEAIKKIILPSTPKEESLRSDWLNVANSDDIVNLVINPPIQSQGMSSADEKIQVQTSIQITLTLETIWNYHNRVVHSDTKPNLITIIKSIERKVHVINKVVDCLEKPLHDTVKLNTDAALLGNEAILAIVARDDSGVIIMSTTKKMFTEDPIVAEASTMLWALQLAESRHF
uniref:RNase H type-1 domain-containing protein n=1 Tax=Fagus sylvatica TaxID=28930 RepID=A0A2N9H2N4_FAGSY